MGAPGGQPLLIDPRGHRLGAGVSAAVLTAAWWTDSRWLVVLVGATLGASALFGLRYSVYGWAWRGLVRVWAPAPAELEPEYGPRFAQTLGSLVLVVGLGLFGLGQITPGWLAVAAVVTLQALLAATGICLGCRLYFLNWWIPSLVTRWWHRGLAGQAVAAADRNRHP
jgi:hypothetical protein